MHFGNAQPFSSYVNHLFMIYVFNGENEWYFDVVVLLILFNYIV